MDNENKNTGVIFPDENGGQTPASVMLSQSAVKHTPSLASVPDPSYLASPDPDMSPGQPKRPNFLVRLVKRADIILALLLILGSIGLVLKVSFSDGDDAANTAANRFETTQIPLAEIIDETGIDFGTQSVTINGPFQLNSSFVVAPSSQPVDAVAGQIYYDQTSNVLAYYNGTQFVPLTAAPNVSNAASVVQSVGAGLNLFGGQLSNSGVLSLQGQTGDVTLTAGPGIGISGTTISNTGVVSLVSGNPTLVITDDANGNYVLTVNLGGAGVTSLNGLAGVLNVANATGSGNTITIDDASTSTKGIAQFNGTNFTVGSGVVNTIQNINTGATPTFAGVNTNNITPSGTLTVGSTGQQLTLQGNASTQLTATGGGFTTAVGFTGAPTGNVTFNFDRATPAGAYTICTTVGNCAGAGGGVSTSGGTANRLSKFTGAQTIGDSSITDDGTNVTASTDLIIQGGDVTIGVVNTQTGTINLAHSGSSFLGSLVQGALTANRTYLLPDADGTVCLSSGNCSGSGSANTLQAAYDAGNTITTSDNRSIAITLADTATDSNFLINLECDTACGANGRFAIQDDAVDVFTISPAGGAVNFINATDSTQAFNIEENGGGNLFTVDTVNSRVGINLGGNNTPTLASGRQGLELRGALRVSGSTVGSHTDLYVTPNGATESAKINVVNYDVPQFGQVIGLGLTAGSHADSRGIGVYDARTGNHQPAIAVFSPNENDAFGFSWEGSNTDAYLKTLGADVNIRVNTTDAANFTATAVNLLQNTSVSGLLAVSTMGVTDTSTYLCLNTLNQLSACSTSGAGSAFVQGGNSFGTTAILGTNDANALQIETSGVTRLTVAADGSNVTFASNVDLLLQGATAYISNPQGTTGSEVFGLNASATANQSVVIGNGATSACANSVAIGYNANFINCGTGGVAIGHSVSTNPNSVAIGNSAGAGSNGIAIGNGAGASGTSIAIGRSSSSGAQSVAIGDGATTSGVAAVALGHNANANGNGTIAIGLGATSSTNNQLVIGGSAAGAGISHAVIGNGVTNATPLGLRLQATSGSGTNVAGANFDIAAGQSTGNASGGNIAFQISGAGSSGGSLNALTTVATFNGINGAANFINLVNSTQGFNVEDSSGSNIFTVDTANARVGINLGGSAVPTLDGSGIEIQGGIRFSGGITSGAFTDEYRTPLNTGIQTKINIVNYDPGNGSNTMIAAGLPTTATSITSTVISVFDPRSNSNHWPTIAVWSPNESLLFGLSWAGSNTEARLTTHNATGNTGSVAVQSGDSAGTSTTTGNVAIRSGNGVGTSVSTGSITIDAGSPNVGGTAGSISIGATNASALLLGRTGLSTNNVGTLTLGQLGTTNTSTHLCRNSSNIIAACATTGAGAVFVQGGNSFGATAVLGTNDSNSLTFETNNATQATIAVGGATTFQNSADSANAFRILTQGSVELFGVDTTASIVRMFSQVVINGAGPDSSEGELSFGGGSWIPVISRIDDADVPWLSEDVLGFEAAGFQLTTGGDALYTLDGFNGRHTFRAGSTFGYFEFRDVNDNTLFNINGAQNGEATFQNSTDSTEGFRILKENTIPLFQVDTSNDRVYIGNPVVDNDGALLVLDSKDTVGDPTGVNGGMYYNNISNTFRCYENGAWYDCLSRHKIVLGADVSDSAGNACTMVDITGLSFSVTSGIDYRFHANLAYTAAATTTGSRFSVNGPASPTVLAFTARSGTSATAETVSYANAYDGGTCTTDSPSTASQGNTAIIEGAIRPSANGTFQLRVGTEVDASAITVLAGSTLEWW